MSGIVIESNNSEKVIERKIEINQTTCNPAWGEIIGDIGEQSDLMAQFESKQTKSDTIYLDSTNSVMFNGDTELYQSVDGAFYISSSKVIFTGEVESPDTGIFSRKVDKELGKGLSTNDYTDEDKSKLAGIEAGAQVNPTWTTLEDKPATFPPDAHSHNHNSLTDINDPLSDYQHITQAEKTKLNSAVTSSTIAEIVTLTQSAYDALNPKLTTTLYIITGD